MARPAATHVRSPRSLPAVARGRPAAPLRSARPPPAPSGARLGAAPRPPLPVLLPRGPPPPPAAPRAAPRRLLHLRPLLRLALRGLRPPLGRFGHRPPPLRPPPLRPVAPRGVPRGGGGAALRRRGGPGGRPGLGAPPGRVRQSRRRVGRPRGGLRAALSGPRLPVAPRAPRARRRRGGSELRFGVGSRRSPRGRAEEGGREREEPRGAVGREAEVRPAVGLHEPREGGGGGAQRLPGGHGGVRAAEAAGGDGDQRGGALRGGALRERPRRAGSGAGWNARRRLRWTNNFYLCMQIHVNTANFFNRFSQTLKTMMLYSVTSQS